VTEAISQSGYADDTHLSNFDTPNHLLFVFSEQILWLDGTFCLTINTHKIALFAKVISGMANKKFKILSNMKVPIHFCWTIQRHVNLFIEVWVVCH